jgi:hypothetical protein
VWTNEWRGADGGTKRGRDVHRPVPKRHIP